MATTAFSDFFRDQPRKNYRVLYTGEYLGRGSQPSWSRPMRKDEALAYLDIFEDAMEIVETKQTKSERREKQARKGRMHRVHNSFRRVLRALIDKRKR